jgi:cellulose synthase/poly-beta-1,6-N-acetylglucosamine synthase-like glycosyltransferase
MRTYNHVNNRVINKRISRQGGGKNHSFVRRLQSGNIMSPPDACTHRPGGSDCLLYQPILLAVTILVGGLLAGFSIVWSVINLYSVYPLAKDFLVHQFKRSFRPKHPITLHFVLRNDLPKFSLLVPAYKESSVIKRCIERIFESNYPRELIEVIVLTEKDDVETRLVVVEKCAPEFSLASVVVEDNGEPKGKPRALNQGFKHAGGEIIGIVDAEDLVSKELLREVALMMVANKNLGVVQGILDMQNESDGWSNRNFRAEYGYWYRMYLPALSGTGLPVPLGGTTNFFRKSVLDEVGLWDTHNVTEDFELGMRLFLAKKRFGTTNRGALEPRGAAEIFGSRYRVGMLNSVTSEESPLSLKGWVRQRTRWEKGKIQTLRKYMRMKSYSSSDAIGVGLAALVSHLGAINVFGLLVSLLAWEIRVPIPWFLECIFYFNFAMLLFHCATQYKGYMYATDGNTTHRRLKAVSVTLTTPAYWVLQWYADLRAIKQEYLGTRTFWEKTEHFGRNVSRSH